jgi:hypothetical protein
MEIRTGIIKKTRGRVYEGAATLDENVDGEGLLVVHIRDMKPGQRVAFRIE